MLLNACRIAARRSASASWQTPYRYVKGTIPVRALSTTLATRLNADSTGRFPSDFPPSNVSDFDSTSFSSDRFNSGGGSGLEELDLTRFADGLQPLDTFASVGAPAAGATTQSLTDLGLGGWSPPGLAQTALDYVHSLGLPWWASIVVCTLAIKCTLFPLVVQARRATVQVQNNMPHAVKLQMTMAAARAMGNQQAASRAAEELVKFYKENKCNPLSPMLPALAQAPFFISFFLGIRQMAAMPIESMKTGGMLWFTDLTVADPYYILPLVTSLTMMAVFEVGAPGEVALAPQVRFMKILMRIVPVAVFPITMWFPSAVLCYWVTSNFFTLGQVTLLNIPAVRQSLNIPEAIKHKTDPSMFDPSQFKAMDMIKEMMENSRIGSELEDRALAEKIRRRQSKTTAGADSTQEPNASAKSPLKIRAIEHSDERKPQ